MPARPDARLLVPALLAVGVLLPLQAAPALACSCAGPASHAEALARAAVVVSGDVLERREPRRLRVVSSADPATYVLRVRRVHAGEAPAVLEVQTANSGASCGLELPGSGPVLLYAQRAEDGGLVAGLCGGSRTATDAEAVAVAGEGSPPQAAASGAGEPAPRGERAPSAAAALLLTAVAGCWAAARRRRAS